MSRILAEVFLLPGLGNSGPEHWQSHWERRHPKFRRIEQEDWETPRCADWRERLDREVHALRRPLVLVGHSTGCALVAHWAAAAAAERVALVRGAPLVAPSDPEGPNYPEGPTGFAPMPLAPLPFASIVVASDDDPFISLDGARAYAEAWGSRFEPVGAAGHINSASRLGDWPRGYTLLTELR